MATAAGLASFSLRFRVFPSASFNHSNGRNCSASPLNLGSYRTYPLLPLLLRPRALLTFSSRRRNDAPISRSKKKNKLLEDGRDDGSSDEDAFEALFSQLEEDLKSDNLSATDNADGITEADMAKLEKELEEAFGDVSEDESSAPKYSSMENAASCSDYDDEEDERPLKIRTWQLRRLAHALKIGRRKTSIKSLAGELGLDRAIVLELLRDPPPDLLLMCASLPDKVDHASSDAGIKPSESSSHLTLRKSLEPSSMTITESDPVEHTKMHAADSKAVSREPVHVMRKRWFMQKRLKKVQVETLEKVYSRTKRPTNAMLTSIVQVTSLPWKKVVKWFEDKRQEDGVPEERVPYRRPVEETVSIN